MPAEEGTILLSRFAYRTSPSSRPSGPGPSRPTSVVRKDPPGDLPDAQLVRLSKCVACRLQWTSKKSAKQKRAHIEQCAKKNALTKDTIQCLVKQEIALVSPYTPANDATENGATLMDFVVPVVPPKKSRRQQVVPTLRSLPETREGILGRARDILGPTNVQTEPEPTQQFGQSALARQKALRSALVPADINGCTDEPPLTQPFKASSLRQGMVEGSKPCIPQQSGASMFAQDSVLSNDRKRPTSPSLDDDVRTMRRRLK